MFQTGTINVRKENILAQLPESLWSKDDSDIGFVKSANPVELKLKPEAVLPFYRPYPMSPEAAIGLQGIINDLLKAGVIEVSDQPRAISPIFAIRKADGVRW